MKSLICSNGSYAASFLFELGGFIMRILFTVSVHLGTKYNIRSIIFSYYFFLHVHVLCTTEVLDSASTITQELGINKYRDCGRTLVCPPFERSFS